MQPKSIEAIGAHRIASAVSVGVRIIQIVGVHGTAAHIEHPEIRIVTIQIDAARRTPLTTIPENNYILIYKFYQEHKLHFFI